MKLLFGNNKRRRFQVFDVNGEMTKPESVGIIHSKAELDYGTPNLDRCENVTIFGSNSSSKETLVIKLKWRPQGDHKFVTLLSQLYFSTSDGKTYHSKEIETYEPQQVTVESIESGRSIRILQFGSRANSLRIYIGSPYRRMRIVFVGQVRNTSDNNASAFLRLTCVMNPTARVFDFLDQYDEQCVRQMYDAKQATKLRTFSELVDNLLLHDRHDQKCRLVGEYLLLLGQDGKEKIKGNLLLWGFHCRHFIADRVPLKICTKRIYSYMINGQAFSLGNNKLDSEDIDFGYVSFTNHPITMPISKPYQGIDWHEQIHKGLEKFQLEVSGQNQTFTSKTVAKRATNENFLWFDVETNEVTGYAWVSLDDETIDTPEDLKLIEDSREAIKASLNSGKLAVSAEAKPGDDELLIVSLDDDECTRSDTVGSKASSLALLIKLQQQLEEEETPNSEVKFRVPRGFATTKRAHDLLLKEEASLSDKIKQLEHQVGENNLGSLKELCEKLVGYVKQLKLPDSIREELYKKLQLFYSNRDNLKFAVRSSSWGEDEEDMSAAGQLSTILNVPNDLEELSSAIMACFASKFSLENIEYKRQHGLPLDMPMSVVIQEMIQCDKAGVLFTCDPTNGDSTVITITANYGLGESVVSAQADPDSIRVRVVSTESANNFRIENISVGQKNVIISDGGNNAMNNLDKSKCCLTDEEILQLAKCAIRVRQYFWSQARDIEWGFWRANSNTGSTENGIYLFQARPVTGLETMTNTEFLDEGSKPNQAEVGFFTRANVGEVMPYAISPLSLTSNISFWSINGARLLSDLLGDEFEYVPQSTTDFYYEKYHSFFNLRGSVFLSLSTEAAKSPVMKSMQIALFGREMGAQPEIERASRGFASPPNPWEGLKFQWKFRSIILFPMWTAKRQRPIMERLRAEVESDSLVSSKQGDPKRLVELFKLFCHLMDCLETAWHNHIVNIMQGSKQNVALTAFLSKFILDPMQLTAATNKFLGISPDVISAEIPERVDQMAKSIVSKGSEELQKFVELADGNESLDYCRDKNKSANEELAQQFDAFLKRFGHRCYNEFELSSKSWSEEPHRIVDMIKINCKSKLMDKPKSSCEESSVRAKTIDEVIESLPELKTMTFIERLVLKYRMVPKSQLYLSVREQTKDIIVYHGDVVRQASRKLAEELQRQLRLPDSDLMYYLFFDELQQLVCAHQPALVMAASRRRQLFKKNFETLWKFDEIISDLTPNHLKQNAELDAQLAEAPKLFGTPASSGRVRGHICLVGGYHELNKVRSGSILLTHSTDIAFSPTFPLISGIITEVGGLISHGAVVAREYGLPSVIGIPNVTKILQDNEEIILDADNGTIIRLGKQQE